MSTRSSADGVSYRVDVLTSMVGDMQRQVDVLTRAVHAMAESMVVIEDAHKLTDAYPFASGRHDAEIAAYANEGWTDVEMAEELGTTAATISRRRHALGIDTDRAARRWGRDDDARLVALMSECDTYAEVARRMPGRTPAGCRNRAMRLGVSMNERHRPWTRPEMDYLAAEWEEGTPIDEISAHVGRTASACRTRACRMGLSASRERQKATVRRTMDSFWKGGAR